MSYKKEYLSVGVVHGLNRFSEDLDFSTTKGDKNFQFDDYMDEVLLTLKQYGLEMKVKKAKDDSFVKARELKEDSYKWTLSFPSNKQLKKVIIKLEIDTNPPAGAFITNANLDFPILHQVKVGTLETLFAGKINALLTRPFMKGRDWYDFLWYVRNDTNINYEFFKNALLQMGTCQSQNLKVVDRVFVISELSNKIKSLDWKDVRKDVERFLKPYEQDSLKIWGEGLFLDRVNKIVAI